jgi:general nucleoside transport system permease protein
MNPDLLIAAALVAAIAILLPATGELLTERAGVLNLGIEGTMLIGAVAGFAGCLHAGSVWAGLALAAAAAGLFGSLFGALVITLRMNQVVTGLAFSILGSGISALVGKPFIGMRAPETVPKLDLGSLSQAPFIGRAFLQQDAMVYLALVIILAVGLYLRYTRPGLVLRALGEAPDVLDSLGINVVALRYLYVIGGASLMGLGGAYLSLAFTPAWIENMTAGRGWIALALVIFAGWRPLWLLGGALMFGLIDALRFRMQIGGAAPIDPHFLNMLPYVATLLVLILLSSSTSRRRLGMPAALGIAYDRERR